MGFFVAFVTLFAAIDIIAVLPVYASLTSNLDPRARRVVLRQSCLTAFLVAVGFALAGRAVFRLLGIEVYDFQIAGGLLLLIFSVQDLIAGGKPRREPTASVGVVPLGMPLIVGPAVLTTIVILLPAHGYPPTLAALLANLVIVWLALSAAPTLLAYFGEAGAKALGKLGSLLLAAVGVMMIRRGVLLLLASVHASAGAKL